MESSRSDPGQDCYESEFFRAIPDIYENENYSNPGFSMSDTNPDPIKFFSGDVALQIRTDDIYLYLMI